MSNTIEKVEIYNYYILIEIVGETLRNYLKNIFYRG